MHDQAENNKRIFKNTIILYVRMILVLLISLYTSRVILKALGVDDFGLYNVVGGVVGLLSFFNVTMARSTQRFLNVSMVEGEESLGDVFASSITVHVLFAALFLIIGETIGLWFLNNYISIPSGREIAANIVYQTSVVSFCISIVTIPYNAAVIAYERMSFMAIVSIIEAILKLCIALFLCFSPTDRLVLYGFLLLGVTVFDLIFYYLFCRKNFRVLRFRFSFDGNRLKKMFSFVSWTLLGESAQVGCNQGNVILVNMFHSLATNAAMGIGGQINTAIYSLTSNFQTAFNPQITKSFAEGNSDYLKKIVYTTSKISFCILFVVALPVSFNIDWILEIWLDEVPVLTNTFAILFLVNALLNAISGPFHFVVLSSGNIRNFQILSSFFYLIDLPITFYLFKMGLPAPTVLWVKIGTMVAIVIVRILFATRLVPSINALTYCRKVIMPLLFTFIVCVSLAFVLDSYATNILIRLAFTFIIESVCLILLWCGCFEKSERSLLLEYLKI